ncbi:MAG: DUF1801 domain-containing protein [Spirochaetia bacterium]|jgi:hypothetical protein|nr:DUF1801 domain-containing protein [Spirochaetia bacterium]
MVKNTELKTKVNSASVVDFLNTVVDEQKRKDCFEILHLMEEATEEPARMWGSSIVGFGSYHYKGSGGREGDWMLTGFSPRKQNLTFYIMDGFDNHKDLLARLGSFENSVGCLYIKKLSDIDVDVLKAVVITSVENMRKRSVSR